MRWMILLLALGCSKSKDAPPAPTKTATTTMSAPKEACPVMPKDIVLKLAPEAKDPIEEKLGKVRCIMATAKGAVAITFDTGPYPSPAGGAKAITGLGGGGSLERLDPTSKGDAYLSISLGENSNLRVEVTLHDDKDHEADAIEIAKAVIARLH